MWSIVFLQVNMQLKFIILVQEDDTFLRWAIWKIQSQWLP